MFQHLVHRRRLIPEPKGSHSSHSEELPGYTWWLCRRRFKRIQRQLDAADINYIARAERRSAAVWEAALKNGIVSHRRLFWCLDGRRASWWRTLHPSKHHIHYIHKFCSWLIRWFTARPPGFMDRWSDQTEHMLDLDERLDWSPDRPIHRITWLSRQDVCVEWTDNINIIVNVIHVFNCVCVRHSYMYLHASYLLQRSISCAMNVVSRLFLWHETFQLSNFFTAECTNNSKLT